MTNRKVIIELKHNRDLAAAAFGASPHTLGLDPASLPKITSVAFDPSFKPAALPGVRTRSAFEVPYVSGQKFDLALEPQESTYVVRGTVAEAKIEELAQHPGVAGVFADVEIQPMIICPGSPPMGTDADVERLLCVPGLRRIGMDGKGVLVAIVDTGFNLAYLAAHGKTITLDAARSWVPSPGMIPGDAPLNHGTMCAYDAAIAAPNATFLDIQVLRSTATGPTPMAGVLSDAVRAYSHLCAVMSAPRRPGEHRSMVVSNSWGMFHPSWDLPPGNPGNYSDNPNHPFNRIVGALEHLGADILFAAGNCGADCPDGRCQQVTRNAIYGANSHPSVLTIGGVDITKTRVGYSTQGPGRLSVNKPDVCGYTHFKGSGVYTADGGTSAATPVVAGVVAALRSKRPFDAATPTTTPAAIRALLRSTAEDRGATGFDFDYGYGVVGGCNLYQKFDPGVPIDLCRRLPWLCRDGRIDVCRWFPWLCKRIPITPGRRPIDSPEGGLALESLTTEDIQELMSILNSMGYEGDLPISGSNEKRSTSAAKCRCEGK